jgi:hypothetical protein
MAIQTSPITSFTTYDLTATLTPDADHPGWFASMIVLTVQLRPGLRTGRESCRFGVGFVGPEGTARRKYAGPELPGPYAFAISLPATASIELARLRDLGLVVDAALGDRLIFQGATFVIERDGDETIKLTLVTP